MPSAPIHSDTGGPMNENENFQSHDGSDAPYCEGCNAQVAREQRRQRKFDVIAVDPPWSYGSKTEARTVRYETQLASQQYDVVGSDAGTEVNRRTGDGIANIAAIVPMDEIAAPVSALFLWTTNPKLPFAFNLMEMWGFTYKTTLTWVKITKAEQVMVGGMGWFFRGATEHVLFGTRGNYGIPAEIRKPNVFYAKRAGHSAKPDEFYDLVDSVTPGQARLDVFARSWRPGWWAWGNELVEPESEAQGELDLV